MRKARITIKDGIKEIKNGIQLMDPDNEDEIIKRIESAIDDILDGTDYKRNNPPTFGVEKDTV